VRRCETTIVRDSMPNERFAPMRSDSKKAPDRERVRADQVVKNRAPEPRPPSPEQKVARVTRTPEYERIRLMWFARLQSRCRAVIVAP